MLFFLKLIPGQSHPPFLEVKQEEKQLIIMANIKNVKIDFFIL